MEYRGERCASTSFQASQCALGWPACAVDLESRRSHYLLIAVISTPPHVFAERKVALGRAPQDNSRERRSMRCDRRCGTNANAVAVSHGRDLPRFGRPTPRITEEKRAETQWRSTSRVEGGARS